MVNQTFNKESLHFPLKKKNDYANHKSVQRYQS